MTLLDRGRQAWRLLLTRVRARLIGDAHVAWRFWSVRLQAAGALLYGFVTVFPDTALQLWNQLPGDSRAALPYGLDHLVPLALFGAGLVARFIKQERHDG